MLIYLKIPFQLYFWRIYKTTCLKIVLEVSMGPEGIFGTTMVIRGL